MNPAVPENCELRMRLPASLAAIERFFIEFRAQCESLIHYKDPFTAELILREVLTNAVLHGCHGDPARFVRCALRANSRRLLIAVEDDGEGFDWRKAWCRRAGPSESSGRGIEILRKYATRVRFNEKGNAAAILKRF